MLIKYLFLLPKNQVKRTAVIFICFFAPVYGLYLFDIITQQPAFWQLLFWLFISIAFGYMTDEKGINIQGSSKQKTGNK
ncbi:hypothetical protein [Shewanella waksmanii]|uniref:hypothetical protein n=1 Tax=Shewanella waksmanii TaxID=213783 RepID=UPI00048EAC26|nr:hypothetical protein [Shewanella waksmanii]